MVLLGYDIGSSSVKASLVDSSSGQCIASSFYPKKEMEISSPQPGWAEQHPNVWWDSIVAVTSELMQQQKIDKESVGAIGLSYQMHGLVITDRDGKPLRPSIIWCDSRSVAYGEKAFREIGETQCLSAVLNSPGNFTASKLAWVKENEPALYEKIDKVMLPGDYIALKLTGEALTTPSGLSEGIFWDFQKHGLAELILDYYGFDRDLFPGVVSNFSVQGNLTKQAAGELGLKAGIPLAYRAGDQPNNAFSLNVLNPGEIAANAGTSGVVYGVSDQVTYDPQSRVNTFAHVNHTSEDARLGVLLCVNGTGILNSWLKKNVVSADWDYEEMNRQSASVPAGSDGLIVLPFGNGAERMIGNKNPGCIIERLDFNRHNNACLVRAAHEGIAFAFAYGIDIMETTGIRASVIRAGNANMFLSPVFRETLAALTNATIELYNTDGSQGAARAAGVGAGIFPSASDAFGGLKIVETVSPDKTLQKPVSEAFNNWKNILRKQLQSAK